MSPSLEHNKAPARSSGRQDLAVWVLAHNFTFCRCLFQLQRPAEDCKGTAICLRLDAVGQGRRSVEAGPAGSRKMGRSLGQLLMFLLVLGSPPPILCVCSLQGKFDHMHVSYSIFWLNTLDLAAHVLISHLVNFMWHACT